MNCFMMTWHPHYVGPSQPQPRSQPQSQLAFLSAPAWVDRQDILNQLDKMPEVLNWRAAIGAIFIVSEANARQLAERLNQLLPALAFVIAPIDIQTMWGWADEETWNFIRRPRRQGQP